MTQIRGQQLLLDSTQGINVAGSGKLYIQTDGITVNFDGSGNLTTAGNPKYAITGNVTNSSVSNTTTKTVIAAGFGLTAAQVASIAGASGSVQRLEYVGTVSSATALDTLTLTLSVIGNTGTIVDITSTVLTMAGNESNAPLWITAIGGWLTAGASGTARGAMRSEYNTSVVTTMNIPTASVTTDTTGGGNSIALYATWSAARSGNILTKRALWSPFLSTVLF